MKQQLGPAWSDEQQAAGDRLRQTWETFFSGARAEADSAEAALGVGAEAMKLAAVRARHEPALLAYPNVVGVSEGVRTRGGAPTGERCIVVYVQRKVPRDQLREDQVLPRELEGVPVDVVEIGRLEPLPSR